MTPEAIDNVESCTMIGYIDEDEERTMKKRHERFEGNYNSLILLFHRDSSERL